MQRTSVEGLDHRNSSRELSGKPCTPIQEKMMLPVAAVSDNELILFSFAFQWKRISH